MKAEVHPLIRLPSDNLVEFATMALHPSLRVADMTTEALIDKHATQARISIGIIAELTARNSQ